MTLFANRAGERGTIAGSRSCHIIEDFSVSQFTPIDSFSLKSCFYLVD
jgi:hypothetical protein